MRSRVNGIRAALASLAAVVVLCVPAIAASATTLRPVHRQQAPRSTRGPAPLLGTMQGVYHNGATLICSDCHVMHASEQHGMAAEVQRSPFPLPYDDTPYRSLLRKSATTDLCLACHDGMTGIPDVLDADTNQLTERAAGFFADAGLANYKGHNLAHGIPSDDDLCSRCHFVGSMATASVACIDCHAPHGNMGYRNLQWASAPGSEPEIRALSPTGLTGITRYEQANVRYVAPAGGDGSFREVTNMCIDCHHAFMDDLTTVYTKPDGMEHWGRHPGTNTEWGASRPIDGGAATSTNPTWWVNGTFQTPRLPFIVSGATSFASAGAVDAKNEVFCLTCHKAHGSAEPFALRWHYGGPPQPNTTDGCQQCHKDR